MTRNLALVLCLCLAGSACAREEEVDMSKGCMESTLAGAWYDANPARLQAELDGYLQAAQVDADPAIFAVIVPHAGYAYSGPCAAAGRAKMAR